MPDFQADLGMLDRVFNQQGVKAETPADWQEQADRAAARQAEVQTRRAAAEKAAQERADEALVRELAVKYDGDPDQIHAELMQVNPTFGAKFGEDVGKWRYAQATALKAQNANEWERHRRLMSKLEAAGDDPVAYTAVRAEILKADPEMASLLPEQYDPVRVGNALKSAVDADKIYAQRNHSVDMAAKGEWQQGLSGALDDPEVDTPEEHATVLQAWRNLGAPPAILAQFATFDPNPETRAARLRQMGLTPDQRTDNAHAAATLANTAAHQAATLANTAAHQRVMEGQGAQRVQIARQRAASGGGRGGASAAAASDVAEFADAYLDGDPDALKGLPIALSAKVRAEILRRGGTPPPPTATGTGAPVKLSGEVATTVAGIEGSLAVLEQMRPLVDGGLKAQMGPISGRFQLNKAKVPGTTVQKELAEYIALEAKLKNSVIKATTGAGMGVEEARRIIDEVPQFTDKPEVWEAKFKMTQNNLRLMGTQTLQLVGADSLVSPRMRGAPAPAPTTNTPPPATTTRVTTNPFRK